MSRISFVALTAALLLASNSASIAQHKTMATTMGIELVAIPPGDFMLGSPPDEKAWATTNGANPASVENEGRKQRKVTIKQEFWLGRTEVTVGQWRKFAEATKYQSEAEKKGDAFTVQGIGKGMAMIKGASWRNPNFGFVLNDNHPACCLNWEDTMAFCQWLTETEKKANRLPVGMVYRLPTEAEWEYACRAGKHTKFWWGDAVEGGDRRLNWSGVADRFDFVSPVDQFGARGRNKFGLADMLGNVAEWCLDEYDANEAHEDLWKGNEGVHAQRGGYFGSHPSVCRNASRTKGTLSPSCGSGFRICCGPSK